MTLNMRNDGIIPFSKWKTRLKGFVKLIEKEKPDIIGTQEMTYKAKTLLKTLLTNNELFYTFYGESRKRNNTVYDEYNCILVKQEIKVNKTITYSLSNTPQIPTTKFKHDQFPRIITLIQTDNYNIYNTHLTPKLLNNKLLQLDCITNIIDKSKPVIIMGDFNLGMAKLKPFMEKNNLTDATEKIGKTFSTKRELFHLDHILITDNLNFKNTIKHNFKYKNIYISDHFPISTEIERKKNEQIYENS